MPLHVRSGRSIADAARRVLASSSRVYDTTQVHPSPPTITVSAANAATSITSGVLVQLARSSSTVIDTVNDPHYEYIGIPSGQLSVSSGSRGYPNVITGGAAAAARHRLRFRFHYTGQALEAHFRQRTTSFNYRIWVDGLPISTAYATAAVTASSTNLLKLDFGSVGSRVIELEVQDPEFGGVWIEPTATLTRTKLRRPLLMGLGDSITGGANGVAAGDTWLRYAAQILGCDWSNVAIGGTGYLTSGTQFRDRITPDMVPQAPDAVVVFGGYNDSAQTQQAVQDEATYVLGQLRAQLPNTLIIAVGCWLLGHSPAAAFFNVDAAVKSAAAANGVPFISLIDPLQRAGSAPAWATATAYNAGDMVVANGVVWKCMTSHTSPGSFATTNWRATTFITGTGRVGATAGNGSADVVISTDGTHPTADGHRALGYHLAQEIIRTLSTIAA
jgi:lysophospholipase L1-like esterase